ncbi:transcriptional regulator, LysR family [Acidiphilium rubrum]|uniref:Transcriptional regulator, LysR family n=1 Tax=Acidiphilium rubrum TaxID=526 RepID=A0A8G2CNI7_ACIRU|nr:transcriptional regulator, LysR family [Acidiphilium rubrum]
MPKTPPQAIPLVFSGAVKLVSISQALVVAEQLSFTRAAKVLGIRQSTVSRRVRALEDQLGVSLFERDVIGVRLTEAGRRFLETARSGLAEIDHAVKGAASAGRGIEGVIRIGIMSSVSTGFVRELLRAFHESHPAILIDVTEGSASEHIARITERQVDVAFVTGRSAPLRCDTLLLWEARVHAVLPESHVLAGSTSVGWNALKDEHFIVSRDAPGPEIHDYIVRRSANLGHSPAVEHHDVSRETLMHLVALGFGLSLVSEGATGTRYPDVVFRPLTMPEDVLPYSAIWLPGNDNPALRRFLSLARLMSQGLRTPKAPNLAS